MSPCYFAEFSAIFWVILFLILALMNIERNTAQLNRSWEFVIPSYSSFFAFVCLLLMWGLLLIPTHAHAKQKSDRVYTEKYAAFVMDADTGLILHRENANKTLHPASLTKMMTLLMVFDAIERGKLKLHHRVRISEHAASMVPSKLDLPVGSSIKVEDAIFSLVTKSANDVAVALGEKLGGSEAGFALMMTKKAREIGMTKTRFKNASGLHDPRQVSTARDMARLARTIITKYPQYYHYFSTEKFTYQGKTYKSHNRLMKSYEGMDGMKTGYIRASGFNLVSSAVRNDRRIIGVVFGGRTGRLRNAQMEILLDQAFEKLNSLQIASTHVPVPQKKPEAVIELASIEPALQSPQQTNHQEELPDLTPAKVSRWDMLDSSVHNSMFNRMIGEGDYDITVRNRIETGLIAISAHLNEKTNYTLSSATPQSKPTMSQAALKQNFSKPGIWAIQIGAFTSRERVDLAIAQSIQKLPKDLKHGKSSIAPLKTAQGWIYRGRLEGYSEAAANDACKILRDCIAISPNSN